LKLRVVEVDLGTVAETLVDRFLDDPLARGLNGETAVDRFLDEPSDWGSAGQTAVDRSLDTGVGLKASAKKDEVSLPQTGPFFAGTKKAAEQQAIPLLIDLMSARESAKKNTAVGSDGCPSEFWKYLSCVSMVVIFRLFLMRLLVVVVVVEPFHPSPCHDADWAGVERNVGSLGIHLRIKILASGHQIGRTGRFPPMALATPVAGIMGPSSEFILDGKGARTAMSSARCARVNAARAERTRARRRAKSPVWAVVFFCPRALVWNH